MFYCNTPNLRLNHILQSYHLLCGNTCRRRSYHISGPISLKKKQFLKLSIIQSVSPWQSYESSLWEQPFTQLLKMTVLPWAFWTSVWRLDSHVGSRWSGCMDLPNNADILLSLGHNHSQLFMFYGHLVHVGETLTELQILGCELHKNAFGSRALPWSAGGAIALLQAP